MVNERDTTHRLIGQILQTPCSHGNRCDGFNGYFSEFYGSMILSSLTTDDYAIRNTCSAIQILTYKCIIFLSDSQAIRYFRILSQNRMVEWKLIANVRANMCDLLVK